MKKVLHFLSLLRIEQWIKNSFVFVPLFFDGKLFHASHLFKVIIAFLAFCFISSSIYCFNDIQDIERDRKHPRKQHRPLASGAVSIIQGYALMLFCVAFSVFWALNLTPFSPSLLGILGGYFIMNIAYCLKLKSYPIIDVFIISAGFILRIFAGGVSTGIFLTPWLVLMTFLLALFLAFAKRRDDIIIYEQTGIIPRNGIDRYNLEFINQVITLLAGITLVCYILYTLSDAVINRFHSNYLYLTAIWVLAAMIKYFQITIVDAKSGSPTKVLLKNRFIQCCVVGWLLSFFFIIY